MNFEDVLISVKHDPHYLNRYIKLVKLLKHQPLQMGVKYRNHHICPKAKDMFPEYTSFKNNPWNLLKVTDKQHRILHLLLFKSYRNRSQAFAYKMLSNFDEVKVICKSQIKEIHEEQLKESRSYILKGKKVYHNIETGEHKRFLDIDDIPSNYVKGMSPTISDQYSNYVWCVDPITDKECRIKLGEEPPPGFIIGRSNKFKHTVGETSKGNTANKDNILYHCSLTGKHIFVGNNINVPAGYVKGKSPELKEKHRDYCKISNKNKGEKNPRYGVTLSEETKKKISDKLTGKQNSHTSKTVIVINHNNNTKFYFKNLEEFKQWTKQTFHRVRITEEYFNAGKIQVPNTNKRVNMKRMAQILNYEFIVSNKRGK